MTSTPFLDYPERGIFTGEDFSVKTRIGQQ